MNQLNSSKVAAGLCASMEPRMDIYRHSFLASPPMSAQRGAVLVVALIFLLLMTILAMSASGRSFLQERMVGGLRNAQQAEMSAQTALRERDRRRPFDGGWRCAAQSRHERRLLQSEHQLRIACVRQRHKLSKCGFDTDIGLAGWPGGESAAKSRVYLGRGVLEQLRS